MVAMEGHRSGESGDVLDDDMACKVRFTVHWSTEYI